jgi:hypothetical protein
MSTIKLFETKQVRSLWDAEKKAWFFSIVDVIAVLTDSTDAGAYWRKLKQRLKAEGNETVTNCHGLKMTAPDGKMRLTDVADTEQLLRLIQSIPSPKAEPFKQWLARVGYERIEETDDPELAFDRAMATYLKKGYSNLVKAEEALFASGVSSSILKSTGAAVAAVAQIKGQIAAQEIKLANMRGYLAESAPDFRQAQTELATLRAQMARAQKEDPPVGRGDSNGDYIAKLRDFRYYETLFELFTKQYDAARIDESRDGAVIQVLDLAQPPEYKSKPKKARIAIMTASATGFALLLFIFVRQALRNAAQSPEKIEKLTRLRRALARSIGRN